MKNAAEYVLATVGGLVLMAFAAVMLAAFTGCGAGGKEDDTQSSSESNVDIVDCSGANIEVGSLEELEELEDSVGEDFEVVVPDFQEPVDEGAGLDQQTLKVIIVPAGCGNTIVNEDNDSFSDDDVNTTVGAASE